jgi:hypothetical protein
VWSVTKIGQRVCVGLHWLLCGATSFKQPKYIDELLEGNESMLLSQVPFVDSSRMRGSFAVFVARHW